MSDMHAPISEQHRKLAADYYGGACSCEVEGCSINVSIAKLAQLLADALAKEAEHISLSTHKYAHMCRDGHQQIGHNDSEHEMCPLCRAIAEAERVRRETLEEAAQHMAGDYNGGAYDWACRCGAVGHWDLKATDTWEAHIRALAGQKEG